MLRPSSLKTTSWSAAIAEFMKARWCARGRCWAQERFLTRSTPLYDLVRGEVYRATPDSALEVPEGAVVVPGSRAVKKGAAAELGISLYTPVIVKYRDEKTDRGIELEDWLTVIHRNDVDATRQAFAFRQRTEPRPKRGDASVRNTWLFTDADGEPSARPRDRPESALDSGLSHRLRSVLHGISAGQCDHFHPTRMRRPDSGGRVFDHQTLPGFTPKSSAPFKYGSGCGFPVATSSAATSTFGTGIPASRSRALAR